MIKRILYHIQMWARRRSFRKARKEAIKENKATGRKVFVVLYQGEFIALTKRKLKNIRKNKVISNDVLQQAEKVAVYVAK